ncbi:MAG: hypothetical protein CMJ76_16420 [Planctomycetaceae bacterium]|nr:hypothetical protein [Planctomycetaceae bacterium]
MLRALIIGLVLFGGVSDVRSQNKPAGAVKKKPAPKSNEIKSKLPAAFNSAPNVNLPVKPVKADQRVKVRESAKAIDVLIDAKLRAEDLPPNPEIDDARFVRRVYLDITGQIPTGREAYLFVSSNIENKREVLIDFLLGSVGYSSHMFNYWADTWRIVDKSTNNTYIRPWADWVKRNLRQNKPYDVMVRQMLMADGQVFENPAVGYRLRDVGMPLDHLNNTVRVFLGTRIGCAQCHDHPFDKWTQKEFYQLAAFEGGMRTQLPRKEFAQVNLRKYTEEVGERSREANRIRQIERWNRYAVMETGANLKFPHDYVYDDAKPNQVVLPEILFGKKPVLPEGASRRQIYAHWMTSRQNPRFTRTIVNRLWKQAFGIGLFEPVDDMTDYTKASNAELEKFLIAEMKRLNYDMKEFLRIVYNTKAYQRSVTYDDLDFSKPYHFQGPVLRRMTAEQVWDSVLVLTINNSEKYLRPNDNPFLSAVKAEPGMSIDDIKSKVAAYDVADKAKREHNRRHTYRGLVLRRASELPQPLPAGHFLRQFGQSDREIIGDGSTEGTVPQLLALFNGPITHIMLEAGSVVHREVMTARPNDRLTVVFLSILGRMPSDQERVACHKEIQENQAAGMGNVIWALLNTREFLFVQ